MLRYVKCGNIAPLPLLKQLTRPTVPALQQATRKLNFSLNALLALCEIDGLLCELLENMTDHIFTESKHQLYQKLWQWPGLKVIDS